MDALDRLRGLALVGMLVHHLCQWLTGDARAVLPGWRSFAVTDAAAVAFFVAAGASMALLVAGGRRAATRRLGGPLASLAGLLAAARPRGHRRRAARSMGAGPG